MQGFRFSVLRVYGLEVQAFQGSGGSGFGGVNVFRL